MPSAAHRHQGRLLVGVLNVSIEDLVVILHQRLILISKAPKIPSHLVLISNSLQRGTSFVVNSDQHHTFPRESARNFGRRGNFDVGNSRVVQHVLQDSITR